MIPTRLPCCASRTATLAVIFDLPVPPRNEWVEMIFVMVALHFLRMYAKVLLAYAIGSGCSGLLQVIAQSLSVQLQSLEEIRLCQRSHLTCLMLSIDLNAEFGYARFKLRLTDLHFCRHIVE